MARAAKEAARVLLRNAGVKVERTDALPAACAKTASQTVNQNSCIPSGGMSPSGVRGNGHGRHEGDGRAAYDFKPAQAAMQRYVDDNLLSGISSAVLVGRDLVDVNCVGWADKEAQTPLRTDHIFRVFSNTKLVTSCAALLLYEEGKFRLDDPIETLHSATGKPQGASSRRNIAR